MHVQSRSLFGAPLTLAVVAVTMLLLLLVNPVCALGAADDVASKPPLWPQGAVRGGDTWSEGRKMLHCCGYSNHRPWSFSWLVRPLTQPFENASEMPVENRFSWLVPPVKLRQSTPCIHSPRVAVFVATPVECFSLFFGATLDTSRL